MNSYKIRLSAIAVSIFTCFSPALASSQFDFGNIIGQATNAIGSLTATDNFDPQTLVGNWTYSSPSVQFQSENKLEKLGGAAAGSAIESKLSPYYKKVGLNKLTLSVDSDLNFVFSDGKIKLTGKITKEDKKLYFHFNAFNKISLGKVGAIATKSGNQLSLAFDAKKMVAIAKTVGSLAGNGSVKQIISILEKYDGIFIGARFAKK